MDVPSCQSFPTASSTALGIQWLGAWLCVRSLWLEQPIIDKQSRVSSCFTFQLDPIRASHDVISCFHQAVCCVSAGKVFAVGIAKSVSSPCLQVYEDESFVLPALLRFGGEPFVDEATGGLLYKFPSLQRTTQGQVGS